MDQPQKQVNKRHRLLSPAAFGIHHKVSGDLKRFFEEQLGHSTFFFYEFFLEKPFTRWDKPAEVLNAPQGITAPFLSRVVYQTGFMPALDLHTLRKLRHPSDIQVVPLTPATLQLYWSGFDTMESRIADTEILRALVKRWLGSENTEEPDYLKNNQHSWTQDEGVITVKSALSAKFLRKNYAQDIIKRVQKDKNYADAALAKLREYELVLRPWLRSTDEKIGILCASISSSAIFWGECIVLYPLQPTKNVKSDVVWLEKLEDLVRERVKGIYVPMLALLENYIYEDELQEKLKSARTTDPLNLPKNFEFRGINHGLLRDNANYFSKVGSGKVAPGVGITKATVKLSKVRHVYLSLFFQCTNRPLEWTNKLDKLERALVELWADRFGIILRNADLVKESLVFAKCLIASPAMVDRILQAVALRHMAKDASSGKERSVKTALVIGGPGSGKDSMAQLIRVFSPGYRFGATKTLNMAMFRPKEAAVPLLLGFETKYRTNSLTAEASSFSAEGVLKRALDEGGSPGRRENSDLLSADRGFTFILDEINSLDVDTQGALLRLLENAELQPLGGLQSSVKKMDLLAIGVMNEDPLVITKRRMMERVLREKELFGGILGDALYEMFRNQRRMRDDLYYRLIRGGEITLPELRERREDIPILFYFIILTDLLSLLPERVRHSWEIELPVYEVLMDISLQWEGNLRELQTVARRIVAVAVSEYEKQKSPVHMLAIRAEHARKAMEEYRRSAEKRM